MYANTSAGHIDIGKATRSGFEKVKDVIARGSADSGESEDTLIRFAGVESTYNTRAKAGKSSASGLFQFTDATWAETVRDFGKQYGITLANANVLDPYQNTVMAAEFMKANRRTVETELQRKSNEVDLYAMHMLGGGKFGGGMRMLRAYENDPNAEARGYASKSAMKANKEVFWDENKGRWRTVAELMQWYKNRLASFDSLTSGKGEESDTAVVSAASDKFKELEAQSSSGLGASAASDKFKELEARSATEKVDFSRNKDWKYADGYEKIASEITSRLPSDDPRSYVT